MNKKDIEAIYALSPLQQGLLFHSLYAPDTGAYVEQMSCTLSGSLDLPLLEQAWAQVIQRHTILRTGFVWERLEKPMQVVQKQAAMPIAYEDWRDMAPEEQPARLAATLDADQKRDFALNRAPLMRLTLIQVADQRYHFIWSRHHLLMDGWSTAIILKELFTIYAGLELGQQVPLPAARPYRDYIGWLKQQDSAGAERFWRAQLSGKTSPTPLGMDRPAADTSQPSYAESRLSLSAPATAALNELARRRQVTLNTLVQGAWALLLSRYTGEQDVIFGATVAGRPPALAGIESMVGLFINTLPVRVEVDGPARLGDWLAQLQATQAEQRQYEYSSLIDIHGWSEIPRTLPLFESLMVFENYPIDQSLEQQDGGLEFRDIHAAERTNYPLTILVLPAGERMAFQLVYDTRRFSASAIERILRHLETLLGDMVARPEASLREYTIMPAEERALLEGWNATATTYAPALPIHQLIAAQAARTPAAVAVQLADQALSYAQLNARANQLAHYLRARGVGPDRLVGVCLERSLDLVVALLAILKAGGAYVPLDPGYPAERLAFMLADSGVTALLTAADAARQLPPHAVPTIALDQAAAALAQQPSHDPAVALADDHLAYMIYTSGSTGRPKGAMNTHGAIRNRLLWMQATYGLTPADRVLQKTPVSFDVSVWEFFWPLLSGATLVLARPEGHKDPAYLAALIQQAAITTLHFVPAMLQAFVEEPAAAACPSLRRIICSGEALPLSLQERVFARLGAVELHNLYGPTEAAVDVSFWACRPDGARSTVPIGAPVANTRLCILDRAGGAVPIGVAGELHIGGVQLARGYHGRPELTAEKFVPDPWSAAPGGRLYRTGDLARWAEDGSIEYLGRLDHQVKIRGFRIELGEIEHLLVQYPGVREALVMARPSAAGDLRLVAYIASEQPPSADDLRAWLGRQLPEYMLPAFFIALPAFPLTPNGKLDRQALPDQELEDGGATQAALTPIEELLAGIWAGVLGVKRVRPQDNFFFLGGHSLLATQLLSRLRVAFQIDLPLRSLFEAPTLAAQAERIALAMQGRAVASPPIQPADRSQPLRLSFAQQRLWFLDQLEPGSAFYTMPGAVLLTGALRRDALQASLDAMAERHESLRTSFAALPDGTAVQRIAAQGAIPLAEVDLSQRGDSADATVVVGDLAAEEVRRPFDLAAGPLVRATLARLGETEHVLLITMHHIISDGWSMEIFVQELAALYAAAAAGEAADLPALGIQYADYAAWQREWLQGEQLESQLRYWREQMEDAPAALELPTDHPRPAIQTFNGASLGFTLDEATSQHLTSLGQREGVTLFMTLLAAFNLVLAHRSGQDDIVVGSPIANRTRRETEGLIGFFANTLALRTRLRRSATFRALLQQIREVALGAYAHQDVPFEQLVEELQPVRDLSRNPLFQVLFVLQNAPASQLEVPDLTLSPLTIGSGTAKFDLTLTIAEDGQGLAGSLEYNTDLFAESTAATIVEQLRTVIAALIADPAMPLSALNLLDPAERDVVVRTWNRTETPLEYASVVPMFTAQARITPDAVAVVAGGERLTYAELNARANQLAGYLRRSGLRADQPVGICVERSLDMAVGVLAILKAGGAYVPLDPAYPAERLAFLLRDSQMAALLTHSAIAERLPAAPTRLIVLDQEREAIAATPPDEPQQRSEAEHLAYVIYTSGSTGTPKGVAMRHGALANLIAWQLRVSPLGVGDRTLQFSSLSFDVSFQELFSTWCSGGTLVLIEEEVRRDAVALLGVLRDERIQRLFLPFIALQQLAEVANRREEYPAQLREVITAGEQLQATRHLTAFFQQIPGCAFHNHYGPSETHVATAHPLESAPANWAPLPPIGRPIANATAYVLDRALRPAPIGVPGELYLGGAALARGYLGRPALTAERFVPNPFGTAGERLYRTGDIARFRPDGQIDFLGRVDHQVKIRGFRIELGELEALLGQHPAITRAAVMVREDAPGVKRLVGYFVPAPGQGLAQSALRAYLQERLPNYMLPSALVELADLPLTPSGKVDRRALPAPTASGQPAVYHAPRTPIEEVLDSIWSQTLGLERCDIQANFFELGGHSLLATQVISRIRDTLQIEVPVRALFEHPTIAALAEHIEGRHGDEAALDAPPLLAGRRPEHPPVSFAQQRLWFLDQLESNNAAYNLPFALRLEGRLDHAALRQSLNAVIRRHEALRTTIGMIDGQPFQQIAGELELELPIHDLRGLTAAEREAAARQLQVEDALRPFDLSRGPLVRTALVWLEDEAAIFQLTMHHIVSDGWSMGIIAREIAASYVAAVAGRPAELPELPVQYADFAAWQRELLRGPALERQLEYWRRQLGGDLPSLLLPTDRPRGRIQTYAGGYEALTIPPELSQAIKHLSQQEGVSLFMTLLAAFQIVLAVHSGQDDLPVGTPIANRTRREIEGLIGFFINTLVLRTSLAGNPSISELLGRVREVALGAYAHQDVPFEQLVGALQPDRDLSRQALFQVMFMLQNVPSAPLELPGLTLRPLPPPQVMTHFDLTMALEETPAGISGSLGYNSDLYEPATIRRLIGHFTAVLEQMAADPNQRIGDLTLLAPDERRQILAGWNAEAAPAPKQRGIHELIAAQAAAHAGRLAVVDDHARLTYAELDRRANRLANLLRALGIGAEAQVAICMERSVDVIVALLGVLKAGGAYVPLEPGTPPERLAAIIAQTGAPVLITHQRHRERLAALDTALLCLDSDPRLERQPASAPPPCGGDLAYVIFTSGSTGTPKGVAVTHAGLLNYVAGIERRFDFPAQASFATVSTFAADLGNTSVYAALCGGGALHIISEERMVDPPALAAYMQAEAIDCLKIVPSHLAALLAHSEPAAILPRQRLILGGESSSWELIRTIQELAPGCQVFNHYGPTETTVGVLTNSVGGAERAGAGASVPLGRPLPNIQAYLLNQRGQPVPVGAPGELHIAGAGLARGYVGRPDQTAERFVPNPFGPAGSRMYRTGDLARYLPDGAIEFLGRADQQVKLRGFRIELGEIEAQLLGHPAVRSAVVLAQTDSASGQKQLVAYIVPQAGQAPAADELRGFLRQRLPEYMLPAACVSLEALPLTPNGKLDRRALPAVDLRFGAERAPFVAPRSELEASLAAIWAEVLRCAEVGIHDHFFSLGGDSIMTIQVVAKAHQAGILLTPREIFLHPTIAELAAVARTGSRLAPTQGLVSGRMPLLPDQRALLGDRPADPRGAALVLQTAQALEPAALEQAVQALFLHHDATRAQLLPDGAGWQLEIPAEAPPGAVERRRLTPGAARLNREIDALVAELLPTLDPGAGRLLRVAHVQREDQGDLVVIMLHQLLGDGPSLRILAEDLGAAYAQIAAGQPARLPAKTLALPQWSAVLADYARSAAIERSRGFWSEAGQWPAPGLPADPGLSGAGAAALTCELALSAEETSILLSEAAGAYQTTTAEMVLTAAAQTVAQWAGAATLLADITAGARWTPGEEIDLSRTVGRIAPHYPLLLDLAGLDAPGDALKSIKEQLRKAPERGGGYEPLRMLRPDLGLEAPPAELAFADLGELDAPLADGWAAVRLLPNPTADGWPERRLGLWTYVLQGQLHIVLQGAAQSYAAATLEQLAALVVEHLQLLIEHCQSPEAGGFTPSDFPEADLEQADLDRFLSKLGGTTRF